MALKSKSLYIPDLNTLGETKTDNCSIVDQFLSLISNVGEHHAHS